MYSWSTQMKIPGTINLPAASTSSSRAALNLQPEDSDLLLCNKKNHERTRRQTRTPKFTTKNGASNVKRSRPETPLLRWKFEEKIKLDSREDRDGDGDEKWASENGGRRRDVSARKLAAGLWRLQLPEVVAGGVPVMKKRIEDGLGFQFSNTAMEGATKWNPISSKTAHDLRNFYGYKEPIQEQVSAVSLVTALQTQLEQARGRIQDLETERKSSKRKIKHFFKKLGEERSEWRRREHEKVRPIIEDIKADLNRERKNRQRIEIVNSKLVNELKEAKQSAKRFMQHYKKERKDRELIEEVCDQLAKEIGEDKEDVEAFKQESMKLREDVEEERKMLQMAEVWREERVQMKLVDAKVALEHKYSQMKKLVADLESFLMSKSVPLDVKEMREAEMLQQAAAAVDIQEVTEFSYEPPNPVDIFAVFEDVNFGQVPEREIEHCDVYSPLSSHASKIHTVSPAVNTYNKDQNKRHVHAYFDQDGDLEEDASGWETVSQNEDEDSTYSPNGSAPSVNNIPGDSNLSASGTDWEEDNVGKVTPITEICLIQSRQMKKSSSISRLWKSSGGLLPNSGEKYCHSNGRLSNGTMIHSSDLIEQWSSPDSGDPHINRGTKGCIEWPRGAARNSLKGRLMEARIESQKPQLRQVLKQKM